MPPASRRPEFGHWIGWIMSTRRRIDVTTLGHESLAVTCLLAPARVASDAIRVLRLAAHAPRFLPTLGTRPPLAAVLRLPRCGQLGEGLPPARSRPCRANHEKRPAPRRGPLV